MRPKPKAKRLPLAITGGIAEGKTTVCDILREQGISVLSSDDVARRLFETEPVQAFLADLLGELAPVSRDSVRRALGDPVLRRAINCFLHPLVWGELQSSGAVAFEVPLLIEAALHPHFEQVWVVTCGLEEQWRRLMERTQNEETARRFLATQLPTRAKLPFADRVIRTNYQVQSVRDHVLEVLREDFCRYLHWPS